MRVGSPNTDHVPTELHICLQRRATWEPGELVGCRPSARGTAAHARPLMGHGYDARDVMQMGWGAASRTDGGICCVCACGAHRPREAGFGIGSSMFGSICRMSCRPAFKNLEEHLGVPARMGPHHDRVGCTIGPLPNIRSRLSPIAPGLTEASTRGNAPRSGRHRTAVRPSYLRKAQWRGTEG